MRGERETNRFRQWCGRIFTFLLVILAWVFFRSENFTAARLLFERAAALGSATAATSAGKTYDSDFLLRSGARGIRADPTQAAAWFRRAVALGDPAARAPLTRIEAQSRR